MFNLQRPSQTACDIIWPLLRKTIEHKPTQLRSSKRRKEDNGLTFLQVSISMKN